jgi:DNA uptake protein ComE-like DNA-binding protein
MKDAWKDYFSFNKKQKNGILVLLSFITLLLLYLLIGDYFPISTQQTDFSSFKAELKKAGIESSPGNGKIISQSSQININSADTNVLLALPKMTSYCAGMIVKYRKKLGGYYSKKQLNEVWGMDSAIFNALKSKIWADTTLICKININTADIKQLAYHPYIKYYLAKAIINYREQHGLFTSLSGLHKMVAIDDSTYSKILPYLTLGSQH